MSYLIGFMINAVVAAVAGIVAALLSQLLPTRGNDADAKWLARRKRAVGAFAIVWLGLVTYGCIDMHRPHHIKLSAIEAAEVVPGPIRASAKVLRAETVAHGDTAQSYVVIATTAAAIEKLAAKANLRRREYRAAAGDIQHVVLPDWWPTRPCEGGIRYDVDRWAHPLSEVNYEIDWCPSERRAYVQRFDY